jgi:hypothetical protein
MASRNAAKEDPSGPCLLTELLRTDDRGTWALLPLGAFWDGGRREWMVAGGVSTPPSRRQSPSKSRHCLLYKAVCCYPVCWGFLTPGHTSEPGSHSSYTQDSNPRPGVGPWVFWKENLQVTSMFGRLKHSHIKALM